MAEGSTWASNVLCRYFLHGVCQRGRSCQYSHDQSQAIPSNVCRFYLKNSCNYGDQCRYDHVKPQSKLASANHESKRSKVRSSPVEKTGRSGPQPCPIPSTTDTSSNKMVTLKKQGHSADSGYGEEVHHGTSTGKDPGEWVRAAEFVPGKIWQGSAPTSYSQAAQSGVSEDSSGQIVDTRAGIPTEICPFALQGHCRYGENCSYRHGDLCEMCGRLALDPNDEEARKKHEQACMKQHEEDMERSFAIQRSSDKVCGICMDVIMEKKPPTERRFGILSNCNHIFCLTCIRKWRAAKQFENKIVRACPECRIKSDFITPSKYWVEDEEEKKKLIGGYKSALEGKPCKYFNQGRGECPFNQNCFYLHAYPDGRKASPKPVRRARRTQNSDGELSMVQEFFLWNYLEERDRERTLTLEIGFDDLDHIFFEANFWDWSDTDSDFSEADLDLGGI